jgi:hypothetical protein
MPVERLLEALGVLFERRSLAQMFAFSGHAPGERPALILSEEHLSMAHGEATLLKELLSRYRHVLVYPFQGTPDGLRALSACVEGHAEAVPVDRSDGPYAIATGFPASGPFAGLRITVAGGVTDSRLSIRESPYSVESVISVNGGSLLVRVTLQTSELFVAGSTAVFDVEAQLAETLAVETCFSALVPLLLFLRHSGVACWRSPDPSANVIIDDINLRPRYGFVDVRALARNVDQIGCAVSIGFIPWNCNRTSPAIAELLRSRWPQLSLSIHGCDHTGAEFSTRSPVATQQMIGLSLDRMRSLASRTGLRYDRVMVFPQGRFSREAMDALRQSEFQAAVNTELVNHRTRHGVPASELLKPAITSYGGFPLYLRRKPDASIANFALDLLLGKPCLVVTHHDDFRLGMEPLIALVGALNALAPQLRWTNLESIVSETYSTRPNTAGSLDIRLLAASTVLALPGVTGAIHFSKAEPLVQGDFEIRVGGRRITGRREGADLLFSESTGLEGDTVVDVKMSGLEPAPVTVQPLGYRAKVAVRRHMSEFRDNYVARSSWARATVRWVRSGPRTTV